MPRRNQQEQTPEAESQSTALALPDDIRRDLLESQTREIESALNLPQVKVMAAGVGMFEFTDTEAREASFQGIVLGSHPRNVLWDKKFGTQVADDDDKAKMPACSSQDGKIGIPREGFFHAALNRDATGEERIDCRTCPYNQWGSGNLIIRDKNPRGKAVTNQRAVYVMVEGRLLPVQLLLPATSIPEFDAYLGKLLNRGRPMQAVLTTFTQKIKTNGGLRWGIVQFEQEADLSREVFDTAIEMMKRFETTIHPSTVVVARAEPAAGEATLVSEDAQAALDAEDDDLPF